MALYLYNWQYVAGFLVPAVGVYGAVFLHALTDEAHSAEGAECNGLYGWLTAGLGVWYTVRMFRS